MCSQGITQFIYIGSGLPSAENTHEVAQKYQPNARVIYVDIDRVAVAHGKPILAGSPDTAFIYGSALEPKDIIAHEETRRLIDFSKPVGVVMMGLLHFFSIEQGQNLLSELQHCLAPGSLLGFTHGTTDGRSEESINQLHDVYAKTPTPLFCRPKPVVEEILKGHKLVAPGLVLLDEWKLDLTEVGKPSPQATRIWYGVVLEV